MGFILARDSGLPFPIHHGMAVAVVYVLKSLLIKLSLSKKVWKYSVLFFVLLFPSITWASEWHCVAIDSITTQAIRSIALDLDSCGYPHVVYRRNRNMYGSWDGSTWCVFALNDSIGNPTYKECYATGSDSYFTLIIDSKDYPHIVFVNNYVWKDEDGWHKKTRFGVKDDPSIVLDSKDHLHTSSAWQWRGNFGCRVLKYTYQDEQGWHNEYVDALGYSYYGSSIALNGNNIPYIAYCASHTPTQSGLFIATKDSLLGWLFELLDNSIKWGTSCSMAMDEFDYTHIAYGGPCLKYAVRRDSLWHFDPVDTLHNASRVALALDQNNCPHISYVSHYWLKYAWWDGDWHTEKVDTIYGKGYIYAPTNTSIAVDKDNYVHIAYCQQLVTNPATFKYATNRPLSTRVKAYFSDEKK